MSSGSKKGTVASGSSSTGSKKDYGIGAVVSFAGVRFNPQPDILLQCFVKVIATSDKKLERANRGASGFSSRFEVGKPKNGYYELQLLHPRLVHELHCEIRHIDEFSGISVKNKQLTIKVSIPKKMEITIQFQHSQHYLYTYNIIQEMINVYQDRTFTNQLDLLPRRSKVMSVNVFKDVERLLVYEDDDGSSKKKKKGKRKKGKSKTKDPIKRKVGISDFAIDNLTSHISDSSTPFYMIPATNWSVEHFRYWFSHIFVQESDYKKVVTLYDHLKEKKMFTPMMKYFRPSRFSGGSPNVNIYDLLKEIKSYEKRVLHRQTNRRSGIPPSLSKTIRDDVVRKVLKYEILVLKENNDMFLIRKFYVLRKQLLHHLKQVHNRGLPKLKVFNKKLMNELRVLWDPKECRDSIFSFLMFHTDLHTMLKNHESRFYELLEDRSYELLDEDDDLDDDYDDDDDDEEDEMDNDYAEMMRHRDPPRCETRLLSIFPQVLDEYNTLMKIRLESISLRVLIDFKRSANYEEWAKEAKICRDTIETEMSETRRRVSDLTIQISDIQMKILKRNSVYLTTGIIKEEEEEGSGDNENSTKNLKKKKGDLVREIGDLRKDMKNLRRQKRHPVTSIQTDFSDEQVQMDFMPKFYYNPDRRRVIRSIIVQELGKKKRKESLMGLTSLSKKRKKKKKKQEEEESEGEEDDDDVRERKGSGKFDDDEDGDKVSVLTTKLVVSRRKGRGINTLNQVGIQLGNAVIPNLFKYGAFHASVLLSNVNINWFSNSLVYINNLSYSFYYEDCLAVDARCPLVVSYGSLWNKIQKLADEIVYCNVNMKYESYKIVKLDDTKLNCQEFTLRLLRILNSTPLFDVSEKYLKGLQGFKGSEEEKLRFLSINDVQNSKTFKKKFKSVWEKEMKNLVPLKKKNILIFQSHSQLDDFVSRCEHIDRSFNFNHPDVYQILKGFDRAFWMMKLNDREGDNSELDPSDQGCPWSKEKVLGREDIEERLELQQPKKKKKKKKKKKENEKKEKKEKLEKSQSQRVERGRRRREEGGPVEIGPGGPGGPDPIAVADLAGEIDLDDMMDGVDGDTLVVGNVEVDLSVMKNTEGDGSEKVSLDGYN